MDSLLESPTKSSVSGDVQEKNTFTFTSQQVSTHSTNREVCVVSYVLVVVVFHFFLLFSSDVFFDTKSSRCALGDFSTRIYSASRSSG